MRLTRRLGWDGLGRRPMLSDQRAEKMNADNTGGERHEETYEDVRLADESLFESAAFERFDLWMDGSLKLLVARYLPLAAPQASRPFLSRFARGRSRKSEGTS